MKSPLIITGPGIPVNASSEALVYLYDLFPTLCNLLNLDIPEGVEGKDISPIIKGTQVAVRNSLFTAYTGTQRAVRNNRWKLIQYPQINHTQLFDLKNDPYELNNLAEEDAHKPEFMEMWTLLEEWQKSTGDTLGLVSENPKSMHYDMSEYQRKPDRHQPDYTLDKYFKE